MTSGWPPQTTYWYIHHSWSLVNTEKFTKFIYYWLYFTVLKHTKVILVYIWRWDQLGVMQHWSAINTLDIMSPTVNCVQSHIRYICTQLEMHKTSFHWIYTKQIILRLHMFRSKGSRRATVSLIRMHNHWDNFVYLFCFNWKLPGFEMTQPFSF